MTPAELPAHLVPHPSLRGVRFWVERGQLCFQAPQDLLSPKLIATIRHQRGSILNLLTAADSSLSERAPLSQESTTELLPLRPLQQGFLKVESLIPDYVPEHPLIDMRAQGAVDLSTLKQALDVMLQRHAILRTRFVKARDDRNFAAIADVTEIPLVTADFSGLSDDKRHKNAFRHAQSVALERFDLARGPLIRCCLIKLDDREYLLRVAAHHVIWDGWSAGIFVAELAAVYNGIVGAHGTTPAVPEPQYADFVDWQRRWLDSDGGKQQLARLRKRLDGASASLVLDRAPGSFYERAKTSERSRTPIFRYMLEQELGASLRQLAIRERCTVWMIAMAGFVTLLRRLSAQEDYVVSVAHTGRTRPELLGMLGCFFDFWPLRIDVSGDPSFLELLTRIRGAYLNSAPDLDVPYSNIAPRLTDGTNDPRRVSLFFNYLPDVAERPSQYYTSVNTDAVQAATADRLLTLTPFQWRVQPPFLYPEGDAVLVLRFREFSERLGWHLMHGHRFRTEAVNDFSASLEKVFAGVVRSPRAPVSELAMAGLRRRTGAS